MRMLGKILKWGLVVLVAVVVAAAGWLFVAPPDLIRVATAYSAKMVCSNTFLAGRDPQSVLAIDVQAPGHPILEYVTVNVDDASGTVSASLLGLFGESRAVRRPGAGCSSLPSGQLAPMAAVTAGPAPDMTNIWPEGDAVEPISSERIAAILDDPAMTGAGMRAVVVVYDGRIVAERYGEGFSAQTPFLGWSMTKTVTAAIIGTLVADGRMSVEQDELFEEWTGDERAAITVADLMAMSSGLEFNEDYGDVTDVTRMLYLQPDMASFASEKPLVGPIGETFNYSSGTTVLLSRIWQDAFDDPAAALAWPREALFNQLGMTSAVLEADARGTYVGSSYLYATARDWARFGEFLRLDGIWGGNRILPEGYVGWMREEASASSGAYGRGQLWLKGPGDQDNASQSVPEDTFWLRGHDGQTIAVVPSSKLVVVRLGLTPSKLAYRPQPMIAALSVALR